MASFDPPLYYFNGINFNSGYYETGNITASGNFLPLTGGTLSGDLVAPNVNATTNLKENGTALSSKYLSLSGGNVVGRIDATILNGTSISENFIDLQNKYVQISGSTMTGNLTGTTINATTNLQENSVNLQNKYVQISGSTMTGNLNGTIINATTNLQENSVNLSSKYLALSGGTMIGNLFSSSGIVGIGTTSQTGASLLTVGNIVVDKGAYNHALAPATFTNQTATGTTINDQLPVLNLCRQGQVSVAFGARSSFKICRWENNTTHARTRMDISLAHTNYDDVNILSLRSDGRVGINQVVPTVALDVVGDIKASATITAPSFVEAGTALTSRYLGLGGGSITGTLLINRPGFTLPSKATTLGGDGDRFIMFPGTAGTLYPYSIGIAASTFWYSAPLSAIHAFFIDGTKYFDISTTTTNIFNNATISGVLTVNADTSSTGILGAHAEADLAGYYPLSGVTYTDICAIFNSSIWCKSSVVISSDERIKKDIQDINDDSALQKILSIQPKTYKYIDRTRGTSNVYGFIAQQIREVIPEAVSIQKEYIPDIYDICNYSSNIITTSNIDISNILNTSNLVKIYDDTGKEYKCKVNEILSSNSFTIDTSEINSSNVFLYGKEINDFNALDKSYIYTLNVGATQQIHALVMELQNKITTLENRLNILENN